MRRVLRATRISSPLALSLRVKWEFAAFGGECLTVSCPIASIWPDSSQGIIPLSYAQDALDIYPKDFYAGTERVSKVDVV